MSPTGTESELNHSAGRAELPRSSRSPKAQVTAIFAGRRVTRHRMVGRGAVFHQVELPGGQVIGRGATPAEAWANALIWATSNKKVTATQ